MERLGEDVPFLLTLKKNHCGGEISPCGGKAALVEMTSREIDVPSNVREDFCELANTRPLFVPFVFELFGISEQLHHSLIHQAEDCSFNMVYCS